MLKLKFVNAFFYEGVTVVSPSCSLISWTCNSVHRTVCTSWQRDVQSLVLWIECTTSVISPIYIPKLPRNYAHSLNHQLAKLM